MHVMHLMNCKLQGGDKFSLAYKVSIHETHSDIQFSMNAAVKEFPDEQFQNIFPLKLGNESFNSDR